MPFARPEGYRGNPAWSGHVKRFEKKCVPSMMWTVRDTPSPESAKIPLERNTLIFFEHWKFEWNKRQGHHVAFPEAAVTAETIPLHSAKLDVKLLRHAPLSPVS